jgi:hypothetical protein
LEERSRVKTSPTSSWKISHRDTDVIVVAFQH